MENAPAADELPQGVHEPRDWRWALGVVGKVFITLGLLILAFVGYQLWGTGIEFQSNQRDLAKEFRQTVAAVTDPANAATSIAPADEDPVATTSPAGGAGSAATTTPAPTTTIDPLERLKAGDVLAAIKLPTISDTTYYVVSGVRYGDLKRGIGHYPGTALPGQYGNAALAGHRTTYGAPFEDLDLLKPGDVVLIDTVNGGHYEYIVERQTIIEPDQVEVLSAPKDPEAVILTLTTCHPKRSVAKRLIVTARLNPETSSGVTKRSAKYSKTRPAPPAVVATTSSTAPASTDATTSVPATTAAETASTVATTEPTSTTQPTPTTEEEIEEFVGDDTIAGEDPEALTAGWFTDTAAWPQIILWGLLLSAIAIGIHLGGKRFGRRWLAIAVGAAPFLVVLYFFFQNVNRLLPPGL